jgi:hypothetical protein
MKTMAEHMKFIHNPNNTYIRNLYRGDILDKSRYSMQQKVQDQFKKIKSDYNNINNFKDDSSNFASNQLQQVGYKYGS